MSSSLTSKPSSISAPGCALQTCWKENTVQFCHTMKCIMMLWLKCNNLILTAYVLLLAIPTVMSNADEV